MDVEFTSVLTESTKLVLYYLGGGVPWLDDVISNHQKDDMDRVGYNIMFGSDERSYERCKNNHQHPQVKGGVVVSHPESIFSINVETCNKQDDRKASSLLL